MKNDSDKKAGVRGFRISFIWVIPLLALLVTGSLLWSNTLNKGPLITLTCKDASGLEAGKTLIKFRSVNIGKVEQISLSDDYQNVELRVRLDPDTDDLLNEDTRFYVVKPRVQQSNITGLDTLLSGYYIQLNQGASGRYSDEFELNDSAPAASGDPLALELRLNYQGSRRISTGDPISYRGVIVGAVTGGELDPKSRCVNYTATIDSKFRDLISGRTLFWINSGIEMSLGTSGVSLSTENFQNLISGGITFDDLKDNAQAEFDGGSLTLYENRKAAVNGALEDQPHYVVMLNGMGNLTAGSLVKLNGVEVGRVTEAPYMEEQLGLLKADARVPVRIALKLPGVAADTLSKRVKAELDGGRLCASQGASNILVNGDMLNLSLFSKRHCGSKTGKFRGDRVIPTVDSSSFMAEISSLAAKMGKVDFEGISSDVRRDLQTLNELMSTLNQSMGDISRADVAGRLAGVLNQIEDTLSQFNGSVTGPTGSVLNNIGSAVGDLKVLLRDLEPAARMMGQKPNSIIFAPDQRDPEPQVNK